MSAENTETAVAVCLSALAGAGYPACDEWAEASYCRAECGVDYDMCVIEFINGLTANNQCPEILGECASDYADWRLGQLLRDKSLLSRLRLS